MPEEEKPKEQEKPTEQPQEGAGSEETPKAKEKPTPPWGTDEEFNPEKAWKLIQDLRSDKDKLKPLADKARELEDAQKSEVDKLNDRIKELEPTAHEAARLRVALDKGLTLKQAKRLVGDTEEELAADADQLLEDLGTPRPQVPARPKGHDDGGKPSDATQDMSKLADSILESGF